LDAADAEAAEAEARAEARVDDASAALGTSGIELYLLRHADAGDPEAWTGDDAKRPLTGKGRKQAKRMGRWLADLGRKADAVVTSPMARALQTATIVAACFGKDPTLDPRLAMPLDEAVLAAILKDARGARRLMLVGHDPDFSSMASALSGAPIALKKAALARIDLDGDEGRVAGSLRWLIPAEAVPDR